MRGRGRGRGAGSGRSRGRGSIADGRVMPEIVGVLASEADKGRITWTFEAGSGFKPFEEECQAQVERLFQDYKRSGSHRVQVESSGKTISLDFKLMTSMVLGSKTVRQIQRVE
ncbi:unnamed protein product [Effrenium voratum]|nr:unnamed protein product [Effrenium voratum]